MTVCDECDHVAGVAATVMRSRSRPAASVSRSNQERVLCTVQVGDAGRRRATQGHADEGRKIDAARIRRPPYAEAAAWPLHGPFSVLPSADLHPMGRSAACVCDVCTCMYIRSTSYALRCADAGATQQQARSLPCMSPGGCEDGRRRREGAQSGGGRGLLRSIGKVARRERARKERACIAGERDAGRTFLQNARGRACPDKKASKASRGAGRSFLLGLARRHVRYGDAAKATRRTQA